MQSSLDNFNVPDRNAKHRLVPSVSLAGSLVAAFDDVSVEDPDFGSIQGKDRSLYLFFDGALFDKDGNLNLWF